MVIFGNTKLKVFEIKIQILDGAIDSSISLWTSALSSVSSPLSCFKFSVQKGKPYGQKQALHNLIENWWLEKTSVTCSPFFLYSYIKQYFSMQTAYLFGEYTLKLQVQIPTVHHLTQINFILIQNKFYTLVSVLLKRFLQTNVLQVRNQLLLSNRASICLCDGFTEAMTEA